MPRLISDTRRPVKVWARELEASAEAQVRNIASLPFIHSHVAVMPDAHAGKGSTIGTVIATRGAVIPAAVGVDIGCGMCALRLPFPASRLNDLKGLRHSIERSVPTGREANRSASARVVAEFERLGPPPSEPKNDRLVQTSLLQLGSLGGGNHFIEICAEQPDGPAETDGTAWILLHSGSRGIGNQLAQKHIDRAKGLLRKSLDQLPDPDLAHLLEGSREFQAYLTDLLWAQAYAKANRNEMLLRVLKDVSHHVHGDARLLEELPRLLRIDCHHNYCEPEEHFGARVWVTRKGAVSARAGQYGIVPGSMGAKSYIVRGKGHPDSFHSCAHGAGRRMSRTEARRRFRSHDLAAQTKGVECRKDDSVLDEIPGAYKDIDQVMREQDDLVEVEHELKQILCVKGG